MSKSRAILISISLSCVVAAAAFVMAAAASAQTGGGNQIVIRAQETNSGQIVVDTVIAAQAGWLAIYTDTSVNTLYLVGWVPIHAGTNTGLKVDVNNDVVEPYAELWAVLHVDRGEMGLMELPRIDGPAQNNGQIVMAGFATQARPGVPAPASAPMATPTPAPLVVVALTAAPVVSAGPPASLPPAGSGSDPAAAWPVLLLLGSGLVGAGWAIKTSAFSPAFNR
jgi:hypothetical protein